MVYLHATGRMIVNVHSANAEGGVGNYMALSKMFVVRRAGGGYEVSEEPVISGNMVKHWHAVAAVELLKSWGYGALCDNCKRHVMYRSTLSRVKKVSEEYDYIRECAIEDLHGFLDAEVQIRRDSLVKFSFIIPVEDLRAEYASVTHNRVFVDEKGAIPREEQAMMVMKREHASGIYGFLCAMNLAFVGVSQANPSKRLPDVDRKTRARAAVVALANLLSGQLGAAQARALPIVKVAEAICVASKKPMPNLAHGFYKDYVEETASIIEATAAHGLAKPDEIKVIAMGERPLSVLKGRKVSVDEAKAIPDAVVKLAEVIDQWL